MAANRNIRSSPGNRARRIGNMRRKGNKNRFRRNIRKASPPSSTSIGGLIATGVRTLTTFLPGQAVVRPLVDALLKAVGFITAVSLRGDNITAQLRPIGLSTNIPLNFGNLLCECKNLGLQGMNSQGMPTLTTNYDTGRIVKMTISAEPTAKNSDRSGDWCMALIPLKQRADQSDIEGIVPNFEDLKNQPGAKYGPANRPLSLLWIPSVTRDSLAAMNQSFGNYTGMAYLLLAYSQEARSSYGNFSPDAFSTRIVVKSFAHFDEKQPMSEFQAGTGGTTLQPNAIRPHSVYIGKINGRSFEFKDEHVVSDTDCLNLKINRLQHPDLFKDFCAAISVDTLTDDVDGFSVVSD